MIKVNWDVEELVALIDVYRRSDEKSAEQIEVELLALSKAFVERAERLGIDDMSNSSPEVFDLILKEFTKRYLT